jgi:hypothetical protein
MKKSLITLSALALAVPMASAQAMFTKSAIDSYAVHADRVEVGSEEGGEYYASGNDDTFGEFGIATWQFAASDFGLSEVEVSSASLALTVNGRNFSDGDSVEFHILEDGPNDLGFNYSALSFDDSVFNGVDASQFNNAPISLGVYDITPTTYDRDDEVDVINLNFEGDALDLLNQKINNDELFGIVITTTDATFDITYSGVGNTFNPGDPELTIEAVPEPATLTALGIGALALLRRKRSK